MIQLNVGLWETLFGNLFPTSQVAVLLRWKFVWGLSLIVLQCLILVSNSILTQIIFNSSELQSPFIMTYVGASIGAVMLPYQFYMDSKKSIDDNIQAALSFDSLAEDLQRYQSYWDVFDIVLRRTKALMTDHARRWNHRQHFLAALLITPAMFLADWAFNAALLSTSIASATVLVSGQTILVYVMAVALSLEYYSHWKLLGVLAGIVGSALTALHDETTDQEEATTYTYSDVITYSYNATAPPTGEFSFPTTNTFGDTLALLAAMAYASYTIQVRLFCPRNEELYSMRLLLGYIGALSFIPLAPVAIWLFCSDQIQMSWMTFWLVVFKGLFDFLISDYLLFRSIILTGPTVASVGLAMAIPMAFVGDVLMQRQSVFSWHSMIGALACTAGFLIVNLAPSTDMSDSNDSSREDSRIILGGKTTESSCNNDKEASTLRPNEHELL